MMAKIEQHRGVRIVTLDDNESIADYCVEDDIAIVHDADGWWTCFVGENRAVEKYDIPFDSWLKALHVAKAAAEFAME
jgi:hypothetical protein